MNIPITYMGIDSQWVNEYDIYIKRFKVFLFSFSNILL